MVDLKYVVMDMEQMSDKAVEFWRKMNEDGKPDLVEEEEDAAVAARVMAVNSMAVLMKVNYEEEIV